MCDELRSCLLRRNIPYCAGRIDGGGAYDVYVSLVPVKRSQRRTISLLLLLFKSARGARLVCLHCYLMHPLLILLSLCEDSRLKPTNLSCRFVRIQTIFVVGYGWSNPHVRSNASFSSLYSIISTLLLYCSTKLPIAILNCFDATVVSLQFIPYIGHGASYVYSSFFIGIFKSIFVPVVDKQPAQAK